MTQADQKREAVHQALRILGGSGGGDFTDRVSQIHGLLRLAVWLGLSCDKLTEIWKASLKLASEEARSKL